MIVHAPAPRKLTLLPLTAQTDGVADTKLTGRPELAVAVNVAVVPAISVLGMKSIGPMLWLVSAGFGVDGPGLEGPGLEGPDGTLTCVTVCVSAPEALPRLFVSPV